MPETILIVDDDRGVRYSLKRMFEEKGMQTLIARNGREAMELLKQGAMPDVALIDIVMPGLSGLELLEAIKEENPRLQVIMVTAHGTTERAIKAMKLGAYDYIQKPFDIPKMWETIRKALQVAKSVRSPVSYQTDLKDRWEGESIVGNSSHMQEVYKIIGQIAGKEVNILITGESGTGKELVARAIFYHSMRNNRPFLSINCAAIPENLLESELFGHEKGAFTGADHKRIGRFEQAHTGTVFLDEIGDMPIHVQAKILRFIQEGEIQRLGSSETIKLDVRLIAATNKHLEAGVKEGWFREDLYYRLNVVTIHLPALRERREDIPQLINYFISRFKRDLQKDILRVRPDAMALLMNAHDDEVAPLTDDELVAEAATLFIAGHETVAMTLSWTLFLLERHPAIHKSLMTELDSVLGGRDPGFEDIQKMVYLDRVIKESMRILTVIPLLVMRACAEGATVGDFSMPKGSNIVVSPLATHHDPAIYPEPKRFLPDRWDNLKTTPYNYLPYSAGPRTCLGGTFADRALRLILPMILQRFRFSMPARARIDRLIRANIMHARHHLPMLIEPASTPMHEPAPITGDIHDLLEY